MRTINLFDKNGGNRLDTIKGSTSTFFTGVDDLINLNFDPYVSGYSFIYWVQLPEWFAKDEDLKYFKEMTQKNFMGFQGLSQIDLQTAQHENGFTGNEYDVVSGITKGNTEFTLTHKEYSGSVMRKLYSKWIYMIRDPRTGIALYPKLFNVEYGARNHTGQLMYINVRPDATNTSSKDGLVEFAAFYSNVFPKNIPLDIYNFNIGNQESPTIDINFSGNMEIGPSVEAYAAEILKEKILKVSKDGEGIPFIDVFGTHTESQELLTGSMKDIFGKTDKK